MKRALLILVGLSLAIGSAWAGRCGPPSAPVYNSGTDSYIVIEGTLSGLPASYYRAILFYRVSFPGKPSSCRTADTYIAQSPSHPYYCNYIIFKHTANNRECWEYFRNMNVLTITARFVRLYKTRSEIETWPIQGTPHRTLTLSPVHTR